MKIKELTIKRFRSHITSIVKKWRSVANDIGISRTEQEIMSGAFKHASI
jgi:hypothetical protein